MTNSSLRVRGGRLEPDDDIEFFHFESLIFVFPVFCGCSRVQNLQAPKGRLWTASKAFKLHVNHGTLWAHLISSTTRSEGVCEEIRACAMDPNAGFPRRVTLAAPKGEWPYTEETPSGAAPTSPPEGVF